MVRRGITRVTREAELPPAHFAQLLCAHRSPAQNRLAPQPRLAKQVIGCLRSAGERSREDFRMGEYKAFPSGYGVTDQLQPGRQICGFQIRFERTRFSTFVAGVDSIDAQNPVDQLVAARVAEDLPDGATAGAPSAQDDGAKPNPCRLLGRVEKGGEARGILKLPRVRS